MSRTSLASGLSLSDERPAVLGALIETTKPGITRMVVITAVIGLVMAAIAHGPIAWPVLAIALLGCVVGTGLTAAGANTLNQCMERGRDSRMARTDGRPLPRGSLSLGQAAAFGGAISIVGTLVLLVVTGPVPALVSAVCTLSYLGAYTPLKPVTPWSTPIGAVPGALPPLIGWTAIAGPSDPSSLLAPMGLALVAIMFVWQLPHFLAIAWMYQEDYARGGFRVLPVVASARVTSAVMLTTTVLLVGVSLLPLAAMPGRIGLGYAVVAAASGVAFLLLCARLVHRGTPSAAKGVFFASIIQLPLLLIALVADGLI